MFISKIHLFIKNIFCRNFYFDEILISIDGIYILMHADHEKTIENDGKQAQNLKIQIFYKKLNFCQ